MVKLVMEDAEPGGIIALHDGCAEDELHPHIPREDGVVAGRQGTVDALDDILSQLRRENLDVVTVGELVGDLDPVVLPEKPAFSAALVVAIAGAALSFRWCWRGNAPPGNQMSQDRHFRSPSP